MRNSLFNPNNSTVKTDSPGVGKNPHLYPATPQLVSRKGTAAMSTDTKSLVNRDPVPYIYGFKKAPGFSPDLMSNEAALRKPLPREAAVNTVRIGRAPKAPSSAGLRNPSGFSRGQTYGIASQLPVLSKLPIPISSNFQ
tara:strand:+ start:641 stop:1057 length:417 start_codon:yes stop_codon:yes gene_type:complete